MSATLQVQPQAPVATPRQQVVVDTLVKQYGSLHALNGVSFGINTGECVVGNMGSDER